MCLQSVTSEQYVTIWYGTGAVLASSLSIRKKTLGECVQVRVASSILLVAAVVLLLMTPAACKTDGISEHFSAVTPALNATNIGSFFTVTGGAVDVVGGPSAAGFAASRVREVLGYGWQHRGGRADQQGDDVPGAGHIQLELRSDWLATRPDHVDDRHLGVSVQPDLHPRQFRRHRRHCE